MGIKDLSKLIKTNEHILLKQHELQDSELIIDGPNILHNLFSTNRKLDVLYGGDYNELAAVIRNFFQSLQTCRVRPLVLMDGGQTIDDRKLRTKIERTKGRFQKIRSACDVNSRSDRKKARCLPILGYKVFLEVLRNMGIEVASCPFEADKEIAKVANEKKCPVLSQDSDFYALNITGGFIPFDSLRIAQNEINKPTSISCKIYHVGTFASFFPRLDMQVIPLLALLFGNDFTEGKTFDAFVRSIPAILPDSLSEYPLEKTHNQKLDDIVKWLLNVGSFSKAKKQLATHIGLEKLNSMLRIVAEAYSLELENRREAQFLGHLPEWFMSSHKKCLISGIFMTIIASGRIFLSSQSEDFGRPSSHRCSRSVRQVLYKILFKDFGKTMIDEYDRNDLGSKVACQKILIVCNKNIPGLFQIPDMSMEDRQNIVLSTLLTEDPRIFEEFEPDMKYLLSILMFWFRKSFPNVSCCHVGALVSSWVFLKTENHLEEGDEVLPNGNEKGSVNNAIDEVVSGLPPEELQKIQRRGQEIRCRSEQMTDVRFDIVHAFAQFQTCIMAAYDLNSILNFPFRSFEVQYLFSGRLLYNCYEILERGESCLRHLLSEESDLTRFYDNILKEFLV